MQHSWEHPELQVQLQKQKNATFSRIDTGTYPKTQFSKLRTENPQMKNNITAAVSNKFVPRFHEVVS